MMAGIVSTLLAVGLLPLAASPAAGADPERVVFGAFPASRGGQTRQQAAAALEAQIGRKLEVVRVFETWSSPFPDSFHNWLRDGGRTPILSIKPIRGNGTRVTWPTIANALPGSQVDNEIRSWARRIRNWGGSIYVTLHHEPESSGTSYGTQANFIAAWRHWVDVFREEGVVNARFMWIMTDYSFFVPSSDRRQAVKWFPGDAWVDAMGIDAYNWATCRPNIYNPWRSLEYIIEPFRQFGLQHPTIPLWLTEWGSWEDPAVSGRKGQWFDAARALFARPSHQQFAGISYFNSPHPSSSFPDCDWWIDTSTSSLQQFTAMGHDALYQADGSWSPLGSNQPPTARFTTSCADLTCSFDASTSTDDGGITDFAWDFGDGATGSEPISSHTYPASGHYNVTLTVVDGEDATDSQTEIIPVGEPPAEPISFVATASSNLNVTNHGVTVPATVRPGDGLLLFVAINTTATINAPTGVTGWQPLSTVTAGSSVARVFWKVAGATDAGATLTVNLSAQSKANVVLAAYRGTSVSTPVAAFAGVAEPVARASHLAPTVSVTNPASWVVTYWSHKDSSTTSLTPPPGVMVRASGTQSGSGRVTGLLVDTGTPRAVGPYSAGTATASAASSFVTMWTIVLAPN
jgi:PKD repeat protein